MPNVRRTHDCGRSCATWRTAPNASFCFLPSDEWVCEVVASRGSFTSQDVRPTDARTGIRRNRDHARCSAAPSVRRRSLFGPGLIRPGLISRCAAPRPLSLPDRGNFEARVIRAQFRARSAPRNRTVVIRPGLIYPRRAEIRPGLIFSTLDAALPNRGLIFAVRPPDYSQLSVCVPSASFSQSGSFENRMPFTCFTSAFDGRLTAWLVSEKSECSCM